MVSLFLMIFMAPRKIATAASWPFDIEPNTCKKNQVVKVNRIPYLVVSYREPSPVGSRRYREWIHMGVAIIQVILPVG